MKISKNQLKLITSLSQKKYRQKYNLFIVEGVKGVSEFINSSFELYEIFATETFDFLKNVNDVKLITESELRKVSNLKTPNKLLAIFKIPGEKQVSDLGLTIALDDINDPGNLGTIIRLCDWFGVRKIICSKNTVDCYNSKVVQATMGSLTRVNVIYKDLSSYLKETKLPTFIADMNGDNVYETNLPEKAVLVMGNEANGVSKYIKEIIDSKISIPRFGDNQQTESLNVATATAILLSEFKRTN